MHSGTFLGSDSIHYSLFALLILVLLRCARLFVSVHVRMQVQWQAVVSHRCWLGSGSFVLCGQR